VRTDTGESFVISPDTNEIAPSISGQPTTTGLYQVNQTLSANAANASGSAPLTTTWQWLRNGAAISGATAQTYQTVAADEDTDLSVRQSVSNLYGNDTATSVAQTVSEAAAGTANITGLIVSDQNSAGEVTLSYSIDIDSAVYGVLTRSSTRPSAARIESGQDHQGNAADSAFFDVWTTSGSDTLPDITSGLEPNTYYIHVVPGAGSNSDAVTSNGFTLETEAPHVVSAQTSELGDMVYLTFNEPLMGTTVPGDCLAMEEPAWRMRSQIRWYLSQTAL